MVDDHYKQIVQVLAIGKALEYFTTTQKKELVEKVVDFQLIVGQLYKMVTDEILQWYVLPYEQERILVEVHDGITRGIMEGPQSPGIYWELAYGG